MNTPNVERDLGPRHLQMEVRPLVKSAVWIQTNKVVCTTMEKTTVNTPDVEGLESGSI